MPVCDPCSTVGHQAADCVNNTKPMCDRTCPCRHGDEPDPAPYWSPAGQEGDLIEADPYEQARQLPGGWVTPGVEDAARAMAREAQDDWTAIGQRGRVNYRLAAYRSRRLSTAPATGVRPR